MGTVIWLMSYRYVRRWFYILAPIILSLYVSTVYGRYHYVIDSVAGIALGILAILAGPSMVRAWNRRAERRSGGRLMNKVFVTGANGFVGSGLCRHLAAAGWDVVGLVRPTSDLHLLDGAGIPLIRGDLRDPASFRIPDGVTHVVHSASIVSDVADAETCRCNIFDLARNLVGPSGTSGAPLRRLILSRRP